MGRVLHVGKAAQEPRQPQVTFPPEACWQRGGVHSLKFFTWEGAASVATSVSVPPKMTSILKKQPFTNYYDKPKQGIRFDLVVQKA